jgi:hypothetical protein
MTTITDGEKLITEEDDKSDFDKYCKKYEYEPPVMGKKDRIIAIGDIHGDLELAKKCFIIAKLMDDNNNWIGGNTYVVQVGDQVDGCRPNKYKCDDKKSLLESPRSSESPEDVKVLDFFTEMNKKARKDGGAVISLYGNHELLNVEGKFQWVSYYDLVNFPNPNNKFKSGKEARQHAFKPGGEIAKELACTRLPAIIIGSFMFVHAGIIKEYAQSNKIESKNDLYKVNYYTRRWLLKLINKDYIDEIIASSSKDSMFWDRILGGIPPNMNNEYPECVRHLEPVLKMFGIKGMIVGHTPQSFSKFDEINGTCGDQLWRIDFGGSKSFKSFADNHKKSKDLNHKRRAQVLEILNDEKINIISEI